MPTTTLSEAAVALLKMHIEREGVRVDDSNREAHRELRRAGIMEPISSFVAGPEAFYRFTQSGWEGREAFLGNVRRSPEPDGIRWVEGENTPQPSLA